MCREPLNCYHYKNTHNIAYKHIAKAVVDTYFHDKLEETIVILTTNNWTLDEELKHLINNWKICTIKFDREQLKAEGNEQELENNTTATLKRPNSILIFNIVKKGYHKDQLPLSLDDARNIVMFLDSEATFVNDCRIFIQRARPQFSLIVGRDNVDKILNFLNLKEVNDIEDNIKQDLLK